MTTIFEPRALSDCHVHHRAPFSRLSDLVVRSLGSGRYEVAVRDLRNLGYERAVDESDDDVQRDQNQREADCDPGDASDVLVSAALDDQEDAQN